MNVEWRKYVGKRYLYVDYEGATSEAEMLATYEEQAKQMKLQSQPSLVLSIFTGTSVGSEFMQRVMKGGEAQGAELLEKSAMVGITGLKNILLDGYIATTGLKGKVRAFDTEADALDWLVLP